MLHYISSFLYIPSLSSIFSNLVPYGIIISSSLVNILSIMTEMTYKMIANKIAMIVTIFDTPKIPN